MGLHSMIRVCWLVSLLCCGGIAVGQNSLHNSNLSASAADPKMDRPLSTTKPLTPKSSMPAEHKTSAPVNVVGSTRSESAELTQIERQRISAGSAKPARNRAPVQTGGSRTSGTAINAAYHKPATGLRAGPSHSGAYGSNRGKK